MYFVPPSVELLGPTTPSFQTRIHDPQISNHWHACMKIFNFECSIYRPMAV